MSKHFCATFLQAILRFEGRPYGNDLRHFLMRWSKVPGISVDCSSIVLDAYRQAGGSIDTVTASDLAREHGPSVAVRELLTVPFDAETSNSVRLAFYARQDGGDSQSRYHVAVVLDEAREFGACDWAPTGARMASRGETIRNGWTFESERALLAPRGT